MSSTFLSERPGTLIISLHVQPKAKRTEIAGVHGNALKLRVAAPPVDDRANEEVIRFFSELLHIPASRITLERGHKSRQKWIAIANLSEDEFLARLPITPSQG